MCKLTPHVFVKKSKMVDILRQKTGSLFIEIASGSYNTCNMLASAIYQYVVRHVLQVYCATAYLQYHYVLIYCYSSNIK